MAKILALMFLIMHIVTYINCKITNTFNYDPRCYEMPESCEGQRFCHDEGKFYPTEAVNNILQGLKIQDRIGEETYSYQSRVSDSPSDPECATKEKKNKPVYYILDNNNQTRVVIQSGNHKFWQKYDLRWCKKAGRVFRTLHFRHLILSKVNMTCNNVKTTLDFQVLTLDKLGMELISTEMPVFCKARYEPLSKSFS